ncbi:MAG: outer membrane beta-barrel protein [Kiritimatiellae bacterium]|nr:outer membrane beta-barrel protein [Kiritimatiellia bacterium]MDD4025475.1 outer membrane beta-barrel protein [Kiritimatiellia bacterium]MDD4621839.1 outer membrane beta-barrel protein [Kiritimatiellia bacterium]
MRKNVSKLFVGSLCAFAFGFSAVAEELTESPRWYVSPGVGMIFPEGNQPIDEGLNLSLRLGYDLTEHWSTEGEFSWAPNMTNNDRWRQKAQHIYGLGLDALYHFDRYSRFDPFLSAGWAVYMADRDVFSEGGHSTLTGPRVGIGAMYHLTDNLSLRADGRALMSVDKTHEMQYTLDAGVVYRFGGGSGLGGEGSGALADLPKDSDGDGLTDEEEAKLGTDPFKADTDGDGLTDYDEVKVYKTDPLNPDTDFDGLSDGDEVKKYKTDPLDRDTDKGGVADGHEVIEDKTNPLDPSDDLMLFEVYIQFDYDTTVIKPEYFKDLNNVVRVLTRNPHATAVIEGHADRRTRSSEKYNQDLSERRAQAVLSYMVGKGVQDKKLTAVGYGFSRPKVQPDLVNGNPENRRVEIYIRGAGTNADKVKYVQP